MKTVVQEIEELRQMATADLIARYRETFGREPRIRNREHLWKRIAWKVQEQRYGGLSQLARTRLEELIAEIDLPMAESMRTVAGHLKRPPATGDLAPGTILTRTWHGTSITVRVTDEGFDYENAVYQSLSAVARAITGQAWNARLFFGLTNRRKSR
ncbi:MAG: DUF2924 domain-containing protein [Planctomycetes bacterium]|nr:DUF2924 domain-containing protein [Planctomycetota bacterium]MBI3844514.1 DUF2924 domain-containing protein [Planctomycetota bacterium]